MSGTTPLYVIGAGGLAREMAQLAKRVNETSGDRWVFAGFIGGTPEETGRDLRYGRVVGDDAWLLGGQSRAALIIGIGNPQLRARILHQFLAEGDRFEFPNLVHPAAQVDQERVKFGRGNAVTGGCVFTCDIEVGDFNLFNLQTTVGHDARIGNFNVINPSVNISGGVTIGDCVLIGTGAQLLENRTVGDRATVGAGAVVTKDVLPGLVVVGVPAKAINS